MLHSHQKNPVPRAQHPLFPMNNCSTWKGEAEASTPRWFPPSRAAQPPLRERGSTRCLPLKTSAGCGAPQVLGNKLPFHAGPLTAIRKQWFPGSPLCVRLQPAADRPMHIPFLILHAPSLDSPWLLLFSGRREHHINPRAQAAAWASLSPSQLGSKL